MPKRNYKYVPIVKLAIKLLYFSSNFFISLSLVCSSTNADFKAEIFCKNIWNIALIKFKHIKLNLPNVLVNYI